MSNSLWPMDCSPPGSSDHGISQARILEWIAISFSRDLPNLAMEPTSSALADGFFTTEPPGKPNNNDIYFLITWGMRITPNADTGAGLGNFRKQSGQNQKLSTKYPFDSKACVYPHAVFCLLRQGSSAPGRLGIRCPSSILIFPPIVFLFFILLSHRSDVISRETSPEIFLSSSLADMEPIWHPWWGG